MEIPQTPNTQQKALYNPLTTDFTWDYKDENNAGHTAIIPSLEIAYFPAWLADMLKKHLIDAVYNVRKPKQNPELDMQEIEKEVTVTDLYI